MGDEIHDLTTRIDPQSRPTCTLHFKIREVATDSEHFSHVCILHPSYIFYEEKSKHRLNQM